MGFVSQWKGCSTGGKCLGGYIMMTRITLKSDELAEVHKLVASSQKIKAIKIVRNNGRILSSDASDSGATPGLREAKLAVDNISGHGPTEYALVPEWHVHSLTVSGPQGERIELDLENLQMNFLTTLSSVGLNEVGRLLGLIDFVKQWQGDAPIFAEDSSSEKEEE
tara:strand:- start:1214 stop:1711 length:498 start_codon:yes stop_codon:yes gene_type:complete